MSFMVVLTTTASREEAEKIARILLEERLVACVNITDTVSSLFWWKGKIDMEKEFLLFMKTHESLFPRLKKKLKEIHSYQVPEMIGLPIKMVSEPYKEWLKETLQVSE
jgi:periplasmic divalent cation tolerance protein